MRSPSRSARKPRLHLRSFESLEQRHLLTGVVINEIHFDPDIKAEQVEFVELYNAEPNAVDMSGWRINKAVDFQFEAGTTLAANDFFVVTQNASDFQSKYGIAADGVWQLGDKLSNDGERIELLDANDSLVDEVKYSLGFPWPVVGDKGESIELIHPDLDNDLPGNWSSSITDESGSLIQENATWNYRKGLTNNPPDDWNEIGFDTATDNIPWQQGQATIGYGDNDDETILRDMRNGYSSIYLRKDFVIEGDTPDSLLLRLYVDDGAILYINGTEVERAHVTAGAKDFDSTGSNHEAAWKICRSRDWPTFSFPTTTPSQFTRSTNRRAAAIFRSTQN